MRSMLWVRCPEWFGLNFVYATNGLFVYPIGFSFPKVQEARIAPSLSALIHSLQFFQ